MLKGLGHAVMLLTTVFFSMEGPFLCQYYFSAPML